MKRVGFITPNDDFYQMDYCDVEFFCKEISLRDENREEFLDFKNNYSYFSPYFDYVMIKKKYLFFNPLYKGKKFLIYDNGAYYINELSSFKYLDNINAYAERKARESLLSDMTIVSNEELGINIQKVDSCEECMIDSNLTGMMSKTGVGDDDGSHIATGLTVLNQLLIKSRRIADDYYIYLRDKGLDEASDAVNYLVSSLGFLRVAGSGKCRIILANREMANAEVSAYLDECEERGFYIPNVDGFKDSMISEYQNALNNKRR